MTDRETLEAQSLENICPCYTYELRDTIDSLTDDELRAIIADSLQGHKWAHENQPEYDTLTEELATCSEYNKSEEK